VPKIKRGIGREHLLGKGRCRVVREPLRHTDVISYVLGLFADMTWRSEPRVQSSSTVHGADD
jgi:hypothetical protein